MNENVLLNTVDGETFVELQNFAAATILNDVLPRLHDVQRCSADAE